MTKDIDKKFKLRFSGIAQFVSNYEEFGKVEIGNNLAVLVSGINREFTAFFEGRELKKDFQRVFLQYDYHINEGPIRETGVKVVEYKLPLTGKICLEHFMKGKVKEYPLSKNL
jgi:hypothetical protein